MDTAKQDKAQSAPLNKIREHFTPICLGLLSTNRVYPSPKRETESYRNILNVAVCLRNKTGTIILQSEDDFPCRPSIRTPCTNSFAPTLIPLLSETI